MQNRLINIPVAVILAALILVACSPAATPTTSPVDSPAIEKQESKPALKVLAVQTFLADIAQNVAGERVTVESLIPIGLDPHAFEPTPQDVRKIAESNVLILNGSGFEEWIEKTLANAGGERLVIEASSGLTMREPKEGEAAHEHEDEAHDDHSVESHSKMVCEQLTGKPTEEEIEAGTSANNATELRHKGEHTEGEHAHEREIITIKLTRQEDGRYGGFVRYEAETEEGYAFTSGTGKLTIIDKDGASLEAKQELPLDCGGMSQGLIYKLTPGEYIVALSGFAAENTLFSAGPVHAHTDTAHEHHHHSGDPHFWFDPTLAVKYVENIRDGLIAADPDGKDTYIANAAAYIAKLNELDGWIKAQVEQIPAERRLLVTDHETFGYFADRYGFTIIGAIVPSFSTGASPSAQELAGLIDQVKDTGAPAIFLESGSSPQLAQQIATETGAKVVTGLYTHSISEGGGKAPTYIDMMKYNVKMIVEALK